MIATGWVLSGLVALFFVGDGLFALMGHRIAPGPWRSMMEDGDLNVAQAPIIGVASLIGATLYAIPATSPLGAIVLTGYLGGAICVYVRLGRLAAPPQILCLVFGVLVWGALYLRDERIRALLPFAS
jgi:hypothetical protein